MPKSTLTWYKPIAKRILKDIKLLRQQDIADEIGESQQMVSYGIRNTYQKTLEKWIRILRLAGYEIREMEADE